MMDAQIRPHSASSSCQKKARHRSSYHGEGAQVSSGNEPKAVIGHERMVQSTPGSPFNQRRPPGFEVIRSAESLVGRVPAAEDLDKYCDTDFAHYISHEMRDSLDMTREEMDMTAHQILLHERNGVKSSASDNSNRGISNFTSPKMQYIPVNAINRHQSQLLSPTSSPTLNHHYQSAT